MSSSTSSYRLKRFLTSKDPDFASALLIYARYTPPSIRSDSREITYWLDHYATTFGDSLYVFGFYRNRQLVAYAQATYFPKEYLYFIDYVTIDERHRGHNVFFELVEHMKQYLENAHPEYRYGVTEVMNEPGQDRPSPEKKRLIRLLKISGFRVIHAPYFQPRLMLRDSESELSGSLLIYCPAPMDRIHGETYLSILRTVYYEHYLRWMSVEPGTKGAYKKHLDALYRRVEADVFNKAMLIVDGYREAPTPPERPPLMTQHRILSFSFQALTGIVLLTGTMLSLKWLFNLSNASFAIIYGLAITSFVAVAGIVSDEARVMFKEFANLAKYFFGRRASGWRPTELEPAPPSQSDPDARPPLPPARSESEDGPTAGVHGLVPPALPRNHMHGEDP
jgi:GNAT superfamily N-acetyltransferase